MNKAGILTCSGRGQEQGALFNPVMDEEELIKGRGEEKGFNVSQELKYVLRVGVGVFPPSNEAESEVVP